MRRAMGTLSPGLSPDTASFLESSGLKFNKDFTHEVTAMGQIWRESTGLHDQIVHDLVPRLTNILTHEHVWKQMKLSIETLGNTSGSTASTPFSLQPVLERFPSMTKSGVVGLRRTGLARMKEDVRLDKSVTEERTATRQAEQSGRVVPLDDCDIAKLQELGALSRVVECPENARVGVQSQDDGMYFCANEDKDFIGSLTGLDEESVLNKYDEFIAAGMSAKGTFDRALCKRKLSVERPECFTAAVQPPKFEGAEGLDFYAKGGTAHGVAWTPDANTGLGASIDLAVQGLVSLTKAPRELLNPDVSKVMFTSGLGVTHTWPSGWTYSASVYFDFVNPCDATPVAMPYSNYNILLSLSKAATGPSTPSSTPGEVSAKYLHSTYLGAGVSNTKETKQKTMAVDFGVSAIFGEGGGISPAVGFYASPASVSKTTLKATWTRQVPWPSVGLFFTL